MVTVLSNNKFDQDVFSQINNVAVAQRHGNARRNFLNIAIRAAQQGSIRTSQIHEHPRTKTAGNDGRVRTRDLVCRAGHTHDGCRGTSRQDASIGIASQDHVVSEFNGSSARVDQVAGLRVLRVIGHASQHRCATISVIHFESGGHACCRSFRGRGFLNRGLPIRRGFFDFRGRGDLLSFGLAFLLDRLLRGLRLYLCGFVGGNFDRSLFFDESTGLKVLLV